MTDTQDDYPDINNDIAIIGMAGRFPMADNIDEFWTKLLSSQDCITRFSLEELEKLGVAPAALADPNFVPAAGYIADQDKFDAHFFEMNPREAENLDPQHRFALEVAWQTLEHAGYTADSVNGSVGVFAGVNMSTYFIFNLLTGDESNGVGDALDTQISVDKDMFASRISYKLNLKGPSIALGTACSTSLVCIHLACQSLLNGESKLALAGGSHIATPNCLGHIYHQGGYSSKDGYCRSFDAKGSGTIGSGGTCFVLLKRMEDALEDNDTIYAVIKGSAVNNDGSEKIGYTAPSISGQTNIIAEAQAVAGVEPDSIRFIEAHGTGTELGDPIEFTALTRAFRLQTERKNFCGIGSVKSNIGHLGVAAGAASIVKAALALKNKIIPESLHFESPNPKLDIGNSPFYVIDKLERIEPGDTPARAGVSSLGIGGTNAHVILEEPPVVESSDSRAWQLLLLSAKTPAALDNMTANLAAFLKSSADDPAGNVLADAAYTLQLGRKEFGVRRAFVVPAGKLSKAAEHIVPTKGITGRKSEKQKKIVFMFPGGGTQYVNMARGLYQSEPLFAQGMDSCAALFKKKMGLDVLELIYCEQDQVAANTDILQRPKNFFAALFAIEYSLAQLWMSWGVKPDALIGHSLGEYIAACIAGVFSLNDAVDIICFRGELFEKIEKGAMFSVTLPAGEAQKLLIDGVSIATINDPGRCVVAGTFAPMQAFEQILKERGVEFKRLLIDTAGHSPMVDSVLEEFGRFLARVKFNKPTIPLISNISGDWVDPAEVCTASYWKKHLRQTVRFSDGVATLLKEPNSLFLEVGPGNALCSFVRTQVAPNSETVLLNSLRHVQEEKDDAAHLLETLGKLWLTGAEIDWKAFYRDEQRKRIGLPAYPFERKRYWVQPSRKYSAAAARLPVADWLWQPSWRLDQVRSSISMSGEKDVVLVFADDQQFSAEVVAQLQVKGAHVVTVHAGAEFSQLEKHNFRIDAGDATHYTKLIAALEAMPNTVVHCWGLSTASDSKQKQIKLQLSFVYLAQALMAQNHLDPLTILGVTRQRVAVLEGDQVDCIQALITGPANVIPYESPNIRFVTLDVDIDSDAGDAAAHSKKMDFAGVVLNELENLKAHSAAGSTAAASIAIRNSLRFVRDFIPLNTVESTTENAVDVKAGGVYLITGGLGGVGMVHAQALAKFATRLVLMQRRSFPEPQAWDAIAADLKSDAVLKEQIKGIRNLQSLGAEVLVVQADVADSDQLAAAIDRIHETFGAIDGLIHCAGYGEFIPIKESSEQIIDAVLAPKVAGTDALLAALSSENLELVLLCSSMSAQTTGYGLVGYVSACAYLDAIAHAHKSNTKTRYLSINWDVWNTPQQSAKARSDVMLADRLGTKEMKSAIQPREGIDVIYRALSSGQPQVIVSTADFQQLLRKNRKMSEALLAASGDEELAPEGSEANLSLYDRPSLSTEYVAPSTDQEKLLASIWQETLGISRVGVNDNFFELGGESLLGVKIVVKAKKLGLFFEPKEMFKTPTIAQIVQGLGASGAVVVDQARVSGEAPCTPVQQQFLNTPWANPNHWNVGALLSVPESIEEDRLKALVLALVDQHDVLRARFVRDGDTGWKQLFDQDATAIRVECIDLSSGSNDFSSALQQYCRSLQDALSVEQGPIFGVIHFKGPTPAQDRLAIIAHHLAMDALSLGIVIEDLLTLLALPAGTALAQALPHKTSSYKDFSLALANDVATFSMMADIDFWQKFGSDGASRVERLSPQNPQGRNSEQDAQTISAVLSAEQTQKILQDVSRLSGLKINELLTAALAMTMLESSSAPKPSTVMIDVVHHGRPELPSLDLSRTVGWFGVGCPLPLTISNTPLASQLLSIKSQIDAVPNKGLSLTWLKQWHPNPDLQAILARIPAAAVSLNYIGQIDQVLTSGAITAAEESIQTLRDASNQRTYLYDVVAHIQHGQLTLNWSFSREQFDVDTIQSRLDSLMQHLQALCDTDWSSVQTSPGARDVSSATLAAHGITPEQIEAHYQLSPFQSEIYRLYSDPARPPSNVTQALSVMEGPLDRQLLQTAWRTLIARHQVLRTRFVKDDAGDPMQLVCKDTAFVMTELDYSNLDDAAQQAALRELMIKDRQTRYDLAQAPAMRLYWITLNPAAGRFAILLSNHQIILDGWTSSLLARDLLGCLMAIATAQALPPLSANANFSRYITWLSTQNPGDTENWWRTTFAGYRPTEVLQSVMATSPLLAAGEDSYAEQVFVVDDAALGKIQECARLTQTTNNAVFQGAWAMTLAQISGVADVVYGVTVSGRSCDLDGITEVVGQCTNSLPVRIQIDGKTSVLQLLQAVHAANANTQSHNLLSLTDVNRLIGRDTGTGPSDRLYSSNFIFENIPMAESGEAAMPIKTIAAQWVDGWQFPLRIFVVPEGKTWVRFAYDANLFSMADVARLADRYQTNLAAIVSSPNATVAGLPSGAMHE
ncbi:hypothetical protein BH11PSE11_BH11PSE11_03490 [soil metagenome]